MSNYSDDSRDDINSSDDDGELTGLKTTLLSRIAKIRSAGSFATSGSSATFVLPGIVVEDVGQVRLPLSSRDAQSLIQASRKAPFGKGNQTLVDETVRKTWEIDGSKVTFLNNAWDDWLDEIVTTVVEELGVVCGPTDVRAELYKMLLYETGAMFKPHKE